MPVLVLFLCLIGNYFIYRDTGDNLEINYTKEFFKRESSPVFEEDFNYFSSSYGLYMPTYLSDDEVLDHIISADLPYTSMEEVIPGLLFSPILTFTLNGDSIENVLLMIFQFGNDYAIGLIDTSKLNDFLSNLILVWCSADLTLLGNTIFKGWQGYVYDDFNFDFLNIYSPSNFDFFTVAYNYITESNLDLLYPLFTCMPTASYISYNYNGYFQFEIIDKDIKSYGSFFDISLINTDNTFKKFQLPFLRNAFESVFNILEFETSYVSSFVLTSFTWMIQLLLLHVVVDTLAFIFKMYHKLMDKVV